MVEKCRSNFRGSLVVRWIQLVGMSIALLYIYIRTHFKKICGDSSFWEMDFCTLRGFLDSYRYANHGLGGVQVV